MREKLTNSEASKWDTLFMLLSLDALKPFLSDLEFPNLDFEKLQTNIRRLQTLENFEIINTNSNSQKENIENIFGYLEKNLNANEFEQLLQWGDTFEPHGTPKDRFAFLWKEILKVLAHPGGMGYQKIPLEISKDALHYITKNVQTLLSDTSELLARVKSVEESELSKWDQDIFERYQSNFEASPLDWVVDMIEYLHFTKVWNNISNYLSSSDKEKLLLWGKAQGVKMGMPVEFPSS